MGVTEILSTFRLVLQGKTGQGIPESSRLEFLEKSSANNFAWPDAEDNTSRSLNIGGIADSPLLRTLLAIRQKSQEPSFWEVIRLFCFISICNFDSCKNPFATITSLSELYFRFKRFIPFVQARKVTSINHGSSTNIWKPWRCVRLWWWIVFAVWLTKERHLTLFPASPSDGC